MKNRLATLALSGVLALSIVGCGQQPAEEKTEEKAEEKTEQVEQVEDTIKWSEAADAAAAAKGAGFEKFGVPESVTVGNATIKDPKFFYAGGVAQATYESGAIGLTIRKGEGSYTSPLTDRDKTEFENKWTGNVEGLDVTFYGAEKDAPTVMTWVDGTASYGVTYQGLGGDELSLTADEANALVKAVKEANSAEKTEEKKEEEKKSEEKKTEEQKQQNTQQQSTQQQSTQQQSTQQEEQTSSEGFSKSDCTYNALASVGASGSATNVTTSDRITGGGTDYYIVEFDLSEAHYRVQVDAYDGTVIDVTESVDGVARNYDDEGNIISYTDLDE